MQSITISTEGDKKSIYESLIVQLESLIERDIPDFTNLANITAALKQTFNWWWVGFYFVKEKELILSAFQGPVACTRIAYGRGVCGKSWKTASTLIVPDVSKFEGHIACSAESKSEIVVPILDSNRHVIAVLDVDSDFMDCFDQVDKVYLEMLVSKISYLFQ